MTPMFASFMIEVLFHFSTVACFVVAVALSCSFEEVLRGFAKEARGGQCAFTPEAHASLFFVTPNTLRGTISHNKQVRVVECASCLLFYRMLCEPLIFVCDICGKVKAGATTHKCDQTLSATVTWELSFSKFSDARKRIVSRGSFTLWHYSTALKFLFNLPTRFISEKILLVTI